MLGQNGSIESLTNKLQDWQPVCVLESIEKSANAMTNERAARRVVDDQFHITRRGQKHRNQMSMHNINDKKRRGAVPQTDFENAPPPQKTTNPSFRNVTI